MRSLIKQRVMLEDRCHDVPLLRLKPEQARQAMLPCGRSHGPPGSSWLHPGSCRPCPAPAAQSATSYTWLDTVRHSPAVTHTESSTVTQSSAQSHSHTQTHRVLHSHTKFYTITQSHINTQSPAQSHKDLHNHSQRVTHNTQSPAVTQSSAQSHSHTQTH